MILDLLNLDGLKHKEFFHLNSSRNIHFLKGTIIFPVYLLGTKLTLTMQLTMKT